MTNCLKMNAGQNTVTAIPVMSTNRTSNEISINMKYIL